MRCSRRGVRVTKIIGARGFLPSVLHFLPTAPNPGPARVGVAPLTIDDLMVVDRGPREKDVIWQIASAGHGILGKFDGPRERLAATQGENPPGP